MENRKTKIVFMYEEITGYMITLFEQICKEHDAKIWAIRSSSRGLTPFTPSSSVGGLEFLRQGAIDLCLLTKEIGPDLICISGWRNAEYLRVARMFKGRIPIVCMSDNVWGGSGRQRVLTTWPFRLLIRHHFDKFIVPGPLQFAYARQLGYETKDILMNLYTCDTDMFNLVYYSSIETKKKKFPHVFLYIGRFSPEKGCDLLIEAFNDLCRLHQHDWRLILIGNGALSGIENNNKIVVKQFMSKKELGKEIAGAGVFCMPSVKENWGVAIHEAAVSGLPLLLSDVCGSAPVFLIPGLNGRLFRTSSRESLLSGLAEFIGITDVELLEMSKNSNLLGQRITPKLSAASIISMVLH